MQGYTNVQLGFEFGLTNSLVQQTIRSLQLPPRRKRDIPPDLADVIRLNGVDKARIQFKCSKSTLDRWIEASGLRADVAQWAKDRNKNRTPVPAGWYENAPLMSKRQLSALYGISRTAINNLIEATGVSAKVSARELVAAAKARGDYQPPRKAASPGGRRRWITPKTYIGNFTAYSDIERAANHLRRFSPNVHRADIRMYEQKRDTWGDEYGVPNSGCGYYFVAGHGVVTNDEMVALARSKGFAQ